LRRKAASTCIQDSYEGVFQLNCAENFTLKAGATRAHKMRPL
jgi:hypothetical protein